MELFEVIENRAFPTTHALLISPFKEIYEMDVSPGKGMSIRVFTYIELLCNPRKSNPYYHGYSESDRPRYVKQEVWGDNPPTQQDSLMIISAVHKYKDLLNQSSLSLAMYDAGMNAASILRDYLNNVDLNERTNGGASVIKPKDVAAAIKELADVSKSLLTLKSKVHEELVESSKTRNDREVGLYEE